MNKNGLKVVCVTESHLTKDLSDSCVSMPHFNLLRSDVQSKIHKHGVCAYVHEDILVDCVSSPLSNVFSSI